MTRRTPAQYDWAKQDFDDRTSSVGNHSARREKVQFVVAHHMIVRGTGTGSALDACVQIWKTRQASAHYGVDGDHVAQYVYDDQAAWATANTHGNHAGISIEYANKTLAPGYTIDEKTWKNGARLAAHLHVTHKLGRPRSTGFGTGGTLRTHQSFYATACPGPYFKTIWSKYVAEAQRVYDTLTSTKPAPSKPVAKSVRFRVGTLNIPLDPAKLPDGEQRVKHAAKAVHDANLHFLACQELDRGHPGDTWYYARLMLAALRKHDPSWRIIKPTLALNENVSFYRPKLATLKRRLADVVLTSPAGGRHATRSTFTIDGVTVAVRNTHLVAGAKNNASRELQGKQLAEISGASTIILGDFNQCALPAALTSTHKTARDHAAASTNGEYGTYAPWGATAALPVQKSGLDHIVVPKRAVVNGYTVVGIDPDGGLIDPFSDHRLTIASITFPA